MMPSQDKNLFPPTSPGKRVGYLGILLSLAFLLGYVDSLIPMPFPVPGLKLGLSNLVTLFGLYHLRKREVVLLTILRLLLVSITFGSLSGLLYGATGAALSLVGMILAKKTALSMVGVSFLGGILHNTGQILMAVLLTKTPGLFWYYPVLFLAGGITGMIIGILGKEVEKRIKK